MTINKFQHVLETVPPDIKRLIKKQGEIAAQLSKILKKRKIKQKEFAAMLNMKESQLSKIMAGNANITLKTITKIETILGEDIIQIPPFTHKVKYEHRIIALNQKEHYSRQLVNDS